MQGKIKSYSKEKGYGFVEGEDGQSYFLHKGNLNNKKHADKLEIGARLQFEPEPTPKGMKAGHVDILPTFIAKRIVPFLFSRKGVISGGEVVWEHTMIWDFKYDDAYDAQRAIQDFAENVCANAVLNFELHRTKGTNGNYIYSEYRPEFTIALIAENIEVASEESVIKHQLVLDTAKQLIANNVEDFLQSKRSSTVQEHVQQVKKTTFLQKVLIMVVIFALFYFSAG